MAIAIALYSAMALAQSELRDLEFIGDGSWHDAANWLYDVGGTAYHAVPRAQDSASINDNRSASVKTLKLTNGGNATIAGGRSVRRCPTDRETTTMQRTRK